MVEVMKIMVTSDCKEIQSVHPKGNQSWIFIGRTDAETPILWPPNAKSWLIGKDSDAGKHWKQEEKGTTDDEMVGWDYRLDGHEFEQALGVGDGQGSLFCCSSWDCKKSDITEQLNWTEKDTEIIESVLLSSWNYVRDQYQKIFENNPHIFLAGIWLWTPSLPI